jgi:hypothetical protein
VKTRGYAWKERNVIEKNNRKNGDIREKSLRRG